MYFLEDEHEIVTWLQRREKKGIGYRILVAKSSRKAAKRTKPRIQGYSININVTEI